MSVLRQIEALEALGEVASLDAPLGDDGDDAPTLADFVGGDGGDAARGIYRGALLARVVAVLPSLEPRERCIVALRYGVGGTWTHADISAALGVSRVRVVQLEAAALAALRAELAEPEPAQHETLTDADGRVVAAWRIEA